MRNRLAREDGMTLIEVIVAALLLALTAGALADLFATGNQSALGTQRQSQLLQVADQQIEQLHSQVKTKGFSALALTSAPSAAGSVTSDPTNPNVFVRSSSGCGTGNVGLLIETNYNFTTEGLLSGIDSYSGCPSGAEPLVVSASGFVSPTPTSVSVGSGTANVYTYVTQTDVGCNTAVLGGCSDDARRVVVAVIPTSNLSGLGPQHPLYETSIFTNPVPSNQPNASLGLTVGVNLG
jgi:type II secretory pathway pseudopilin PulG